MEVLKNYIGGEWLESVTGETTASYNPATGEVIGIITRSNEEDVHKAVEAARAAFKKWRLVPAPVRGELLMKIGQGLEKHKEELAQLLTREMGKVLPEARGDVQEARETSKS